MTLTVTYTKGLSKSELEAVKLELKGIASIRWHKQKYAWNFIDISPLKKDNYTFSQENFNKVKKVIEKYNLCTMNTSYLGTEHELYIYKTGVNYVGQFA